MNTILNRIDRLMMAITFAEANEPELAQKCIDSRNRPPSNRAQQTTKTTGAQIALNHTAH